MWKRAIQIEECVWRRGKFELQMVKWIFPKAYFDKWCSSLSFYSSHWLREAVITTTAMDPKNVRSHLPDVEADHGSIVLPTLPDGSCQLQGGLSSPTYRCWELYLGLLIPSEVQALPNFSAFVVFGCSRLVFQLHHHKSQGSPSESFYLHNLQVSQLDLPLTVFFLLPWLSCCLFFVSGFSWRQQFLKKSLVFELL